MKLLPATSSTLYTCTEIFCCVKMFCVELKCDSHLSILSVLLLIEIICLWQNGKALGRVTYMPPLSGFETRRGLMHMKYFSFWNKGML